MRAPVALLFGQEVARKPLRFPEAAQEAAQIRYRFRALACLPDSLQLICNRAPKMAETP